MTPRGGPDDSLYDAPELYDAEFGGYRGDLRFYRHASAARPGAIVEGGCGTGRLWMLLGEPRGYVGVDASAAMLRRFSTRARGRAPRLVAGDVRAMPLRDGAGALAVLAYNMLQHAMTAEDLGAALREAARVCPSVALDTFMPPPPGMARRDEDFGWVEQRRHPGGAMLDVAEQCVVDEATRVQVTRLRFEGGGSAEVHAVTRRLWEPDALRAAIAGAGLRIDELWGDVDGAAWDARSPRFMALCGRAR